MDVLKKQDPELYSYIEKETTAKMKILS